MGSIDCRVQFRDGSTSETRVGRPGSSHWSGRRRRCVSFHVQRLHRHRQLARSSLRQSECSESIWPAVAPPFRRLRCPRRFGCPTEVRSVSGNSPASMLNSGVGACHNLQSGISSPIDGCLGAILRFEALEATPGAEVSCAWDAGASWTECSGPESGQWLDSQSWHDGRIKVALGTEGGDSLARRAELRLGLPERLVYPRGRGLAQEAIPPEQFLDLLTYEDSRLVLRLPSLRRDEQGH